MDDSTPTRNKDFGKSRMRYGTLFSGIGERIKKVEAERNWKNP